MSIHRSMCCLFARPFAGRLGLAGVLTAVVLAGCAHYQDRPLDPARLMHAYESRSLDSPDLKAFVARQAPARAKQWPPARWTLDDLTLAGIYYSPVLDQVRAKWAGAQADLTAAGQKPNPDLTLPLQYSTNAPSGQSAWLYGFGLDFPIETAGKRGYRIKEAQALSAAARWQISLAAWHLRSQLREALLDRYQAEQEIAELNRENELDQQLLAVTNRLGHAGAIAEIESVRIQTDLDALILKTQQAQQKSAAARARIATLIGLPLAALKGVPFDLSAFATSAPVIPARTAQREAILNRADLRAALADYTASQAALQLEIVRQYPDIHIGPGYTFDQGQDKYGFQLGLVNLGLFNRNQGGIARASARREAAASEVMAVQARAINQTDTAIQALQAASAQLQQAKKLLHARQAQTRQARIALDAGAASRMDVVHAQLAETSAREAYLAARMADQHAAGELEDALQRPLATGN